jgi:serine/threonine-protein kinase
MGEVWAAASETDHREVAIKVLLARAAMKPDLVRRFEREAKIASAINSPYVCQLLEVREADDGAHLLVFEQLTGESLADRLKREQYLPFNEVGAIIDDILQGLCAAHAAHVIHRDLKPGNIFIEQLRPEERRFATLGLPGTFPRPDEPEERDERAKILDFGISKLARRGESEEFKDEPTLTAFDATLGSFAYMAPEQVRGAKGADERADIYAVGAVAFRALSGRLPFEASTGHYLVALKLERSAPSLAEATGERWPAGIERFLERALSRKRERRFPSALEALEAWRAIQPSNITRPRYARNRTEPPLGSESPPTEVCAPAPYVQPEASAPAPVVQPEASAPAPFVQPEASAPAPFVQPEASAPAPFVQPEASAPAPFVQPEASASPITRGVRLRQRAPAVQAVEDSPTELDNSPNPARNGAAVEPKGPTKRRKTGRT